MSVLSGPQQKLVEAAADVPDITRDELAERTGYSASSGGFNNLVGALCTLDISKSRGPAVLGCRTGQGRLFDAATTGPNRDCKAMRQSSRGQGGGNVDRVVRFR
jgi:hypothetical protein